MKQEQLLQELEYAFICDFIKTRKELHLTQQALADLSGVMREKIAKIESNLNSPQLNSLIKVLAPIGYTVKIMPIDKEV